MNTMIKNPAFPKDKPKARALTKEQLAQVNAYLVKCLNTNKVPKDAVVVDMLTKAKMPINFS